MQPSVISDLRSLPSTDALLSDPAINDLKARHGHELVVRACREVLLIARDRIRREGFTTATWPDLVAQQLATSVFSTLGPVINGSGVLIHTNLGRVPLSDAAISAMGEVAHGYSNLEFDLVSGGRGSRYDHVSAVLAEISGAEAALVVNNAAAALVLVLATFAAGRDVIISRSHLVEIGGGFRIPDIMRQSGAILHEVGTTNRTYLQDYTSAVGERAAMFLRVHSSNFRLEGFVHQPALQELTTAAHDHGLMLVEDLGSGALLDTTQFGLEKEPMVQESVAAGVDLTLFSGDKLLGGPQAGCIVGTAAAMRDLRHHPLARALRVDKTTLAALDATLRSYQRGRATEEIPVWRMIVRDADDLRATAERWRATLEQPGIQVSVRDGFSTIGGGAMPGQNLPTSLLALSSDHPDRWAAALRQQRPAVIARIEGGMLLIDPRTVLPQEEQPLLAALAATRY